EPPGPAHAVVGEQRAQEDADRVVAQRRDQRAGQTKTCGTHRGDRSSTGRPQEIRRQPLFARPWDLVQAGHREVEERRLGAGEIHPRRQANASCSAGSRRRYPSKISRAVLTEGTSGCSESAFTASSRDPSSAASIVVRSTSFIISTSARAC